MESHPVPQNVTAFEFHLIGNMTMRQFGYLAIGLAIAYVTFILFAASLPFLAYPIIVLSASIGAAYAFLPIMERPLDHWTAAFIKAILRPTLRKYRSSTAITDKEFDNRLNLYLSQLNKSKPALVDDQAVVKKVTENLMVNQALNNTQPSPETRPMTTIGPPQIVSQPQPIHTPAPTPQPIEPKPTPAPIISEPTQSQPETPPQEEKVEEVAQTLDDSDKPVDEFIDVLNQLSTPASQPASATTPPLSSSQIEKPEEIPSEQELDRTVALAKEAQIVQNKILEAEKQIEKIKNGAAAPGEDPKKFTSEFQTVLIDLQKLNEKAREISHELAELSKTAPTQTAMAPVVKPNIIPTLTLTQTPNIINGIVTDSQGNYIEGAIVVAHDKQGIPVRALKSNKLGQFIAATPLNAGTYTITVEKEDLVFDIAEIELKDEVINPIIVSAKKGVVS